MQQWFWIFLGGGLGSVLRYAVGEWTHSSSRFPFATLWVNIIGSMLIGFLMAFLHTTEDTAGTLSLKNFLITGFCGGFTTFSAFSAQNLRMWQDGNYGMSFVYILGSIVFCLVAVWVGHSIGRWGQ
ncbi:MAG TPA: fluoride efflux transporter CrcB, partial [Chitinophagaceae bacterium]|nr:fluoride efflux transporter CrcB [Chitinophagaceae bacterium]